MFPSHSRKAAGWLTFALLTALPGISLAADAELQERAQKLDQAIQDFKKEVLDFNVEAQQVEDDILYPPHSRVTVYLSVKVPGLVLKTASVSVDNGPPQTVNYGERDAKALLAERRAQRLLRANLAPGAHRIRLTYSGQFADAKPDAPPVSGSYEAVFDKDHQPADLEFSIARPYRFAAMGISLQQWRPKK